MNGDSFIIPAGTGLLYDVVVLRNTATGVLSVPSGKNWTVPPLLNTLEIRGRLQFATTFDGVTAGAGEEIWLELQAQKIFNRNGEFFIHGGWDETNNKFSPYPTGVTASIVFRGRYGDVSMAFTNEVEGGNKILINAGNVTFVGSPLTTRTKGRLYETLAVGATTAKISKDSLDINGDISGKQAWGFAAGINITIAGTDMSDYQSEQFTITGTPDTSNADYDVVTLDHAAVYRHIGGPETMAQMPCDNLSTRRVDFRAEVTSWNKNIRLSGSNQENIYSPLAPYHVVTDNNTDWGCTVLHSSYKEVDPSDPTNLALQTFYFSESLMKDVQMYNCSQRDTSKAFVRFEGANFDKNLIN